MWSERKQPKPDLQFIKPGLGGQTLSCVSFTQSALIHGGVQNPRLLRLGRGYLTWLTVDTNGKVGIRPDSRCTMMILQGEDNPTRFSTLFCWGVAAVWVMRA
ncbi:hypothetical protein LIA77_06393 [Sarocladium implicatum]|nr:hypothetical protein LIA77_06393 [Sarocladium implicatum]